MSTINVNYMTKAYNNFIKKYNIQSGVDKSMSDTILEKISEDRGNITNISAISETRNIFPKDMTMEEYKAYISDKISQIPMHPSHMCDSTSVNISEAGFEAMKNDPEYEKWVLDQLKEGFSYNNPWGNTGAHYVVLYFGATKEESHGESWYAGYQDGNGKKLYEDKSQNSFWERRTENKERIDEQIKKQQEKKRLQKAADDKAAYEEYVQHKLLIEQNMKTAVLKTSSEIGGVVPNNMMSKATDSYEANFSILDNIEN